VEENVLVEEGWTPLHRAVKEGNINAMKLLFDAGAKVDETNKV
jgi:ankyrin repeat protein